MTPRQIALVQESWKLVQPIADKAAKLFYMRLFSLEPPVQRLFTGDMTEQGRKLMSMISVAVNSLARLESIAPAVQALGRRHAGYGVQKHHYAVVEAALIWTLAQATARSTVSLTAPRPELYAKRVAMTKAGTGIQAELYASAKETESFWTRLFTSYSQPTSAAL